MSLYYEINESYNYYKNRIPKQEINKIISEKIETYLNWVLSESEIKSVSDEFGSVKQCSSILAENFTTHNGEFNYGLLTESHTNSSVLLENIFGKIAGKGLNAIRKKITRRGLKKGSSGMVRFGRNMSVKGGKMIRVPAKVRNISNRIFDKASKGITNPAEEKSLRKLSDYLAKNTKMEPDDAAKFARASLKKPKNVSQKAWDKAIKKAAKSGDINPKNLTQKQIHAKLCKSAAHIDNPKVKVPNKPKLSNLPEGAAKKGFIAKTGSSLFKTIKRTGKLLKFGTVAFFLWSGYKWLVDESGLINDGVYVGPGSEYYEGGNEQVNVDSSELYSKAFGDAYRNVNKDDYLIF